MQTFTLRRMEAADRAEVAELICLSTNVWYRVRGSGPIFPDGPAACEVFFEVYEALDPGRGLVAVGARSGRLVGSCFFHPRPTHVSLGIMNVHPNAFGQGVARALLTRICELADAQRKPLRLVSSAMNLDSFSLYSRAGFVPRAAYQDVMMTVPADGLPHRVSDLERVREATADDVPRMVALERELAGLEREKDFAYFVANELGFWHVSVLPGEDGRLDGFMASSAHPGCNMIGPGAARSPEHATALILAELDRHRGRRPVLLAPVDCPELVHQLYAWGGRNCELHFGQVRGPVQPPRGVLMPTFLPESA
ncbi:MAG: GNAT family N-acetyltransferase [Pirellulales bacterium]|nr:GNAT family N-acetyltransferase [Pirellulales bacterium]